MSMMVLRPHREGALQAVTSLFEDDVVRKVDCGRCSAGHKGHHARAAGHGGQHVACRGHDDGPRDHATRTAIAPWKPPTTTLTGLRVAARRFVGRRSVNVVGSKLRGQLACWEAVQCDRLRQLLARVAAAAALPGVGLPTALDPKGGACT